jgi:hypothetical protein
MGVGAPEWNVARTGAEAAGRPGLDASAERCGSKGSGGGGPELSELRGDPRELERRCLGVQRQDGGGGDTGAERLRRS